MQAKPDLEACLGASPINIVARYVLGVRPLKGGRFHLSC